MASPAKAVEIIQYLREHNFAWEPTCINGNESQRNHISIKRKSGSIITRKITRSHLKELEILLPEGPEKEEVKKAFKMLSLSSGGGSGGGRTALSREDYISQTTEVGLSSNSAGILQLNAAKLFDFKQGSAINRNGEEKISFDKRDFDFAIDLRSGEITLKLKPIK